MSDTNQIAKIVKDTQPIFESKMVSENINFDAEAGFAIQSLMANDFSMKTALTNKQSLINAVTNVAAIGISLNPAKKQAYLVPRKGSICLDISYMGLIDLAVATGSILWAQCVIVYENDDFEINGVDKQPTHKYDPFSNDRGAISGAYSCVKTPQGDFLTHAMPISKIFEIRDRSEAYKKGYGPWKTDEGEMIKKTVIKQAHKYWPKTSPRLEEAIHHLNLGEEGIDFRSENAKLTDKNMSILDADNPYGDLSEEATLWLDGEAKEINLMSPETQIEAIYEKWASLTNSEIFYLNQHLNSKVRSAIKKHQKQLREQKEAA